MNNDTRYKLTDKGWKAYERMEQMHHDEIAKQEAEVGEQYTEYGWSCIDDYDHIHNIDDQIDLLIYTEVEDVLYSLVDWAKMDKDIHGNCSINNTYAFGYSYKDVINRISERGLLEVVA
jgi:hypothetical protein